MWPSVESLYPADGHLFKSSIYTLCVMTSIDYKIVALLFAVLLPFGVDGSSFNVGCFNIRFLTSSDQGELSWYNRKAYVARTITHFGYDIIGINEMSAGEQRDDMISLLPEYTFVGWGSDSATDPLVGTVNSILFRTDKFELLDEGHFFLSQNIDKPQISWDCSRNKRLTVWAKLKVKESDEILYYFLTHLDHQGSDARNEGARINMEKIREITGHYPAIITGDHNSSAIRYPFYDLFSAYMEDARKESVTPFPWTKDGTLCKWNPATKDGTRLDYIWVKGATVNTYNHIDETFGRDVTPSDHFPIIANITLKKYVADHSRYVDASASDDGDGSLASPFNTLQRAIDSTCCGDTIFVAEGDYTVTESGRLTGKKATVNVTHSLTIIGGYNRDFTEVIGRSRISGNRDVYRVITVQKPYALELSNFEVSGGRATDNTEITTGAGIGCLGSRCVLDNVIIRDNEAKGNGGGVYAAGQLICNECMFVNNISGGNGGGYYTHYSNDKLWWRHTVNRCYFDGNKAIQGSAGYHGGFSWAYVGQSTFSGNQATHSGTVSVCGTVYDSRATFVNNTFVNNKVTASAGAINEIKGGAAIFVRLSESSPVTFVNNTIVGNHVTCDVSGNVPSDFHGAAFNIYSGTPYLYSNIIVCNTTDASNGGDVYAGDGGADTRFNLYSCDSGVNFKTHADDIIAATYGDAVSRIYGMLDCKVEDGNVVPNLSDEDDMVPVVKLKSNLFGDDHIDVVPYAFYNEKMLNGDVDNNQGLNDKLVYDQRGFRKNIDGTGSIGAYEYGKMSGIESNYSDLSDTAISVRIIDGYLEIITGQPVHALSLYSLTGGKIMDINELEIGRNIVDLSMLHPGIYIVAWEDGVLRILKK